MVPVSGDATGWIIGAVVSMLIPLFSFPIIFGPCAIFCGYKVQQNGNRGLGTGLMVANDNLFDLFNPYLFFLERGKIHIFTLGEKETCDDIGLFLLDCGFSPPLS
jgi:hypothetical protein